MNLNEKIESQHPVMVSSTTSSELFSCRLSKNICRLPYLRWSKSNLSWVHS